LFIYDINTFKSMDSLAIARITGSKAPVYRVRIGDNVMIDN